MNDDIKRDEDAPDGLTPQPTEEDVPVEADVSVDEDIIEEEEFFDEEPIPVPKRRGVFSGVMGKIVILAMMLAVAASAFAVWFVFVWEEPVVLYRDHELPVLRAVPKNKYDTTAFFVDDMGWINYETEDSTALKGVDVSSHQGVIDWQAVADSGISFAILRAGNRGYGSDGNMQEDLYYRVNLEGALAAGLDVGVYFFSQAISVEEAEKEAEFLLRIIDGDEITYPVVFDWEFIPAHKNPRTEGMTGELLTDMANAFCDVVADAGHDPAVYFNMDTGYMFYDLEEIVQYPFWLASYSDVLSFYYHFDIWQYTHTGTVPGIAGNVDINLAFSDLSEK